MGLKIDKKKYPNVFAGHTYAEMVVSREIAACVYTIGACKRYLEEVEAKNDRWYFDIEAAEKFLRTVQKFEHVKGKWQTKNIKFEPWQCFVWMNIYGFRIKKTKYRRFRTVHLEVARGNAKLHSLDTLVPTPDGMKYWKDIEIGSRLYDRNGGICRVIGKTPIHSPQMYEVEFSDGAKLKVSDEHLWFTSTKQERARRKRHDGKALDSRKNTIYEKVRSTKEIASSLKVGGYVKETNHSVRNAAPVIGEKQDLEIDPYVLGYWLGNGTSATGIFSCDAKDASEIRKLILKRGYKSGEIKTKSGCGGVGFKVDGLHVQLKDAGVLGDKHIPEKYFLSTIEDRLELVRGLLDSDGSINPTMKGQVTFTNKNWELADGLNRLLCSLGYKTHQSRFKVSKKNNFKSDTNFYRVSFYPRGKTKVFNLKRKSGLQVASAGGHSYVGQRYIVGARKLRKRHPGFCVEVDSPDKSYLIGENYIPTHNSAMASQCSLYELALDDPNGNEISTVATKKDQARIVLDSSRQMALKNKSFLSHTGVKVLAHNIVHPKSASNMRALAADSKSLDGLNDILAVMDELHAMDRDLFEVITSGMSKRSDSLVLCITTAGSDISSVGYSQSAYAKKVCLGEVEDDTFFAIVYTLDKEGKYDIRGEKVVIKEDDNWEDETVWIKPNPNLGVSVDVVTLRAKIEKAIVTPADVPGLKIKHFNLWISEANAFYDQSEWDRCANTSLRLEDFYGRRAFMGIDLASHVDITTISLLFKENGKFTWFTKNYIPEETVRKQKNDVYEAALKDGSLIATPGAAINYDYIRKEAEDLAVKFRIEECLYDTWNATEMAQKLSGKIEMVKIAMNVANFSEPMKKLDALMRKREISHSGSPLDRWCIGNVVAKEDHNGNVYPRKSHTKLKIDPVIAGLMALAGWLQNEDVGSVYEERGIRVI